jgi:hypothetical protein
MHVPEILVVLILVVIMIGFHVMIVTLVPKMIVTERWDVLILLLIAKTMTHVQKIDAVLSLVAYTNSLIAAILMPARMISVYLNKDAPILM